MSNPWAARIAGLVAVVGVVVGIVLVVTGGDDEASGPSTTTSTTVEGQAPEVTLALDDTSLAGVSSLAGLVVPDGVADFLSAGTEDRTQLDVTFTLPPDQVATFVDGSGFPALIEGEEVVTHSSPLWKLNPEGSVSGAADRFPADGAAPTSAAEGADPAAAVDGAVVRAVETVPEGERVRIRLVITPAG